MKYIRIFCVLTLSIFALGACASEEEDTFTNVTATESTEEDHEELPTEAEYADYSSSELDLDFFENDLDGFEPRVYALEVRFSEITSEGDALNDIRLESRALLDQLNDSHYEFGAYLAINREAFCLASGGFIYFNEQENRSLCSQPSYFTYGQSGLRRSRIQDRYWLLSAILNQIIYSFFGNNLADFERHIDELEATLDDLEESLQAHLAYIEANDEDLWEEISGHNLNVITLTDPILIAIVEEHSIINHLESGIEAGIIRYTLANPDRYPPHCADPNIYAPDCPQWDLFDNRLMDLRHRPNILDLREDQPELMQ